MFADRRDLAAENENTATGLGAFGFESMQLHNKSVAEATAGHNVGFKVAQHAREHDKVLKLVE